MSKSYGNTIGPGLTGDALRQRVMAIVTDSASVADAKDPSRSTIVQLYRLIGSPAEVARMEDEFRAGGVGYGEFKRRLFEALDAYFTSFRTRREALARDPGTADYVLQDGATRARAVALETMTRVRRAVGLS